MGNHGVGAKSRAMSVLVWTVYTHCMLTPGVEGYNDTSRVDV